MVIIDSNEIVTRHGHPTQASSVLETNPLKFKILLIDDDEVYGALMVNVAKSQGIRLDYFPSLSAAGHIGAIGKYDAAILDYFLDSFTGAEIAEYFDVFFSKIPVLLVSGRDQYPADAPKPKCVRKFLSKSNGPRKIIEEALTLISPI